MRVDENVDDHEDDNKDEDEDGEDKDEAGYQQQQGRRGGLRKRTGVREASGWFRSKQPDSDEDGQEDEEDDEEEHKEVGVDVVH